MTVPAVATSFSTTKPSSLQYAGKKKKITSKGKLDIQGIREFEPFYNIGFYPQWQDWMRQVVECRLQELDKEHEAKSLKA